MSVPDQIRAEGIALLESRPRVVLAVYGPQGSGKTTCTRQAAVELSNRGIAAAAISIDDFYKPHAELQQIAARGNPLLQYRGLPGTHDTGLMLSLLQDFLAGKRGLQVPVYDKSLHAGRGDRAGTTTIGDDVKVLLVEGWMVGFRPIGRAGIASKLGEIAHEHLSFAVAPTLENYLEIDRSLEHYVPIWELCHAVIKLQPEDMHFIYKWRLHQEHMLIAAKGTGQTDEQVKAFVDQYWPCYILYADTIVSVRTCYLDVEHKLVRVSK